MSVALEPEEEVALTASSLWMLPLLLLQLILQLFGEHFSKLKQMRRSRPLPRDWQGFYPKLREAEWPIHVLLAEGARQLLAGQKLDLQAIVFDPDPPDSFQPPLPRSALAMHRRMEELARFNADPERYVRRHADRIRDRDHDRDHNRDRKQESDVAVAVPVVAAVAVPVSVPLAVSLSVAVAIRGPPSGG